MTRSKFHLTLLITLIVAAVSLHAQSFSVLYNFGTVAGDPNQLTYPGGGALLRYRLHDHPCGQRYLTTRLWPRQ